MKKRLSQKRLLWILQVAGYDEQEKSKWIVVIKLKINVYLFPHYYQIPMAEHTISSQLTHMGYLA